MKAFGLISLLLTMTIVAYLVATQHESGATASPATIKKSEELSSRTALTAKMGLVKDAIGVYKVDKDKNPPDLQALVDGNYLNQVPAGLIYNPETGEVSLAPQP